MRTRYFPDDIFAEHAWVLLLGAYLHHADGDDTAARDTSPPLDGQVMGHWRRYLEQQGLIEPGGAPADIPALTPDALDRMERYLDELAQAANELA